ncbi:MAG: efflux RND transporter permease subunit [Gammaproteobacteria bacterium]
MGWKSAWPNGITTAKPAQGWEVHTQQDSVAVARKVKAVIAQIRGQLPEGLQLITWWDDSEAYDERITTLLEDGLSGFLLVCLVLTLFLRLRVALWAAYGRWAAKLTAERSINQVNPWIKVQPGTS